MPELPEVQTVMNGLSCRFEGKTIAKVTHSNKNLRIAMPKNIKDIIKSSIIRFERRAKLLLIHLDNDQTLIIHLGMTGKFVFDEQAIPSHLQKHNHFRLDFSDCSCLIFNDVRRFGFVDLIKTRDLKNSRHIKALGPEPLSKSFNEDYLFDKLKNRNSAIKLAIMNNSVVVGVGNIYACESLFTSKINPITPAKNISKKKLKQLIEDIRETLEIAIEQGGSTLKDYVQADGSLGYFQHQFKVYGKKDEPCTVCKTPIEKITIGQRSTFYCPVCQKLF